MLLWHTEGITEGLTVPIILGMVIEGDVDMLPLLFGGLIALDSVQLLYGAYRKLEVNRENERYWRDYKKNTGITPLYPYRAGSVNDYLGTALEVNQGVVSLYKKYR